MAVQKRSDVRRVLVYDLKAVGLVISPQQSFELVIDDVADFSVMVASPHQAPFQL